MKKQLLSIAGIMLILVMGSSCKTKKIEEKNSFTRREWAIMLSEAYGIDFNFVDDPYYEDIDKDDPQFEIIQALYEYKVLSQKTSKFKPDDTPTLGFVVSSAVLASGVDYSIYDVNPKKALLKCAKDLNIYTGDISETSLTKHVSKQQAEEISKKSKNANVF